MKIVVPPIKSQGIKTKLVKWIHSNINELDYERWVEPFMGTGVVAFNIRPRKALLCDSNPHIINFYNSIKSGAISGTIVRKYLSSEGEKLKNSNGEYYYEIRNRFNEKNDPLDFLFLSRACFNGMMRFNKKGGFNVPFCKKPNRFSSSLITKITNQVNKVSKIIELGDFEFKNQDFKSTLEEITPEDLVYADPPYIGRHVDYFDSWTQEDELILRDGLMKTESKFVLSTWLSNKYRTNGYIFSIWEKCYVATKEHFYHVGAKESNRNSVYEALLSNIQLLDSVSNDTMKKRINGNLSRLTSSSNNQILPQQLTLNLKEKSG